MKRFGLFKRNTTSSQSQSGGANGHQDSSSEVASKPEPDPTSPEEWVIPDEIPSAPTPPPSPGRISRQERRRRERELRKMIRKREPHVFVGASEGSKYFILRLLHYAAIKVFEYQSGFHLGGREGGGCRGNFSPPPPPPPPPNG